MFKYFIVLKRISVYLLFISYTEYLYFLLKFGFYYELRLCYSICLELDTVLQQHRYMYRSPWRRLGRFQLYRICK